MNATNETPVVAWARSQSRYALIGHPGEYYYVNSRGTRATANVADREAAAEALRVKLQPRNLVPLPRRQPRKRFGFSYRRSA